MSKGKRSPSNHGLSRTISIAFRDLPPNSSIPRWTLLLPSVRRDSCGAAGDGQHPDRHGVLEGRGLIESGFVANFARPGRNVTGVHMLAAELAWSGWSCSQAVPQGAERGCARSPGRGLHTDGSAEGCRSPRRPASRHAGRKRSRGLPASFRWDGEGPRRGPSRSVSRDTSEMHGRSSSWELSDVSRQYTNGPRWPKPGA